MNAADTAIAFARAQIDKPYVFGATGPNAYDCSGLVSAAYKSAGITLGRTTYQQILDGTSVDRSGLQPGDLIFPDPGHVQLYVGNNEVIEAPHTGAFVRQVQIWGFWKARRVADPGQSATLTSINPLNPASWVDSAQQILQGMEAADKVAGHLVDPEFWKRVGLFATGSGVVVASILVFTL